MTSVFCDLDGVVANLPKAWAAAIEKELGIPFAESDFVDYDVASCPKIRPDDVDRVYGVIRGPGFFANLELVPGAKEGIQQICEETCYSFYFVTTPCSADSAKDKLRWVDLNFPKIGSKNVILLHHKWLLSDRPAYDRETQWGDVFIDDSPDNLKLYAMRHKHSLCLGLSQPYNSNVYYGPTIRICNDWTSIVREATNYIKSAP